MLPKITEIQTKFQKTEQEMMPAKQPLVAQQASDDPASGGVEVLVHKTTSANPTSSENPTLGGITPISRLGAIDAASPKIVTVRSYAKNEEPNVEGDYTNNTEAILPKKKITK